MCELCNPDTRDDAANYCRFKSIRLRSLAADYDALADGKLDPHSDKAKQMLLSAHVVIKFLVEEWL